MSGSRASRAATLLLALCAAGHAAANGEDAAAIAERLIEGVEGRPIDCPRHEDAYRFVRLSRCARLNLGAQSFQRRLDELLDDTAEDTGPWQYDFGVHSMWFRVGGRPFQVRYYENGRRLVLQTPRVYPRCIAPVGGWDATTDLDVRVRPDFPESARGTRTSSRVVVLASVGADGVPFDVCVKEPSATPGLGFEQSAVEAVEAWRGAPRHGNDVVGPIEIVVQFPRP